MLPRLPKPDAHGNHPAVEYARASPAQNIRFIRGFRDAPLCPFKPEGLSERSCGRRCASPRAPSP